MCLKIHILIYDIYGNASHPLNLKAITMCDKMPHSSLPLIITETFITFCAVWVQMCPLGWTFLCGVCIFFLWFFRFNVV